MSYCYDGTGCIAQADTSFAAYSNETLQSAELSAITQNSTT